MRGSIIRPQRWRGSSDTIRAIATATMNTATACQPDPAGPHHRENHTKGSNRSVSYLFFFHSLSSTYAYYLCAFSSSVVFQGSSTAKGSSIVYTSGTSTPSRGRRQLPQTPLTPRPAVAYKTANSSPVQLNTAQSTSPCPSRLSRGLSEHDTLLSGNAYRQSPVPVTRIGSDPSLGPFQQDPHLSDAEDFQDALSTYGTGRSPRTYAASGSMLLSRSQSGVPNGYHYSLGVSAASGSSGRVSGSYQEKERDDWC